MKTLEDGGSIRACRSGAPEQQHCAVDGERASPKAFARTLRERSYRATQGASAHLGGDFGRTDAVMVLGAALAAPGVPGPALRRRLEHGVAVLLANNVAHLVVSGGVVGPPPAEAHVMRDLALARGVAAERIVVEDRARNTFENAVYAGHIMRDRQWRRVVVVTDAFHLPRALYVFRRLGLEVAGEGVPRPLELSRLFWACAHVDERIRLVRSAALFAIGAHKPLLAKIWGA